MSADRANCRFAIPKKGRLYEKVTELLRGAGISFRREDRLDVAECTDFPLTLVFLPAADIAKYVGQGNVDLGITGLDVVLESNVQVEKVMDLGFGACKLCVQAPTANGITDVQMLAGKRIVTSFPHLTKQFFDALDAKNVGGTPTCINFVSGSVEVACGLGLADAVVDLVETGTTMKVSECDHHSGCNSHEHVLARTGSRFGGCCRGPGYRSNSYCQSSCQAQRSGGSNQTPFGWIHYCYQVRVDHVQRFE